jgi:hypothetical protein
MDEREGLCERENQSTQDAVESTTRDDKVVEESKDFESMIPA